MEKISIDGRVIPTINGGHGSGNFGHSGRPGKIGGSGKGSGSTTDEKIEEAKQRLYDIQDGITTEEEYGGDTSHLESLEQEAREELEQLKEQKLAEIRKGNQEKRDAEAKKVKAEREEHIKQIDKIIGKEKISEGKTKAEDEKNYKKLEKDITAIKRVLAKEKSRENFGQEEVRKLRDKYSDYMSGNWSVVGKFQALIRDFEEWADNYQNW